MDGLVFQPVNNSLKTFIYIVISDIINCVVHKTETLLKERRETW